jgi:CO/xanthine dehydrogenase FAD-binding subunit
MKPAAFEYVAASTVAEALEALGSTDEARVLAGGQSLVPLMNLRLATPALLVDVNGVDQLDGVQVADGEVRLGALCRHRRLELDPEIRQSAPLLAEAASFIAHPQVRNRGTIGGSLAHGDPAAELAAAIVALDGHVRVAHDGTHREIRATELFRGFFETALEPGELLVEVVVPGPEPGAGAAFREFAPRHGDFAVVGVGTRLVRDDGGRCTAARAAACGLGSTPVDLTAEVDAVVGQESLPDAVLQEVAARVGGAVDPIGDIHADAETRRELAQLLTVEAVRAAWDKAR